MSGLCRILDTHIAGHGDPGKTRTSDTQFRKLLLYPPELRGHFIINSLHRMQDNSNPLLTTVEYYCHSQGGWSNRRGVSGLKSKRARYQQGTIREVARANGSAWEVRFSYTENGKRTPKSLHCKRVEYPTQASVRKARTTRACLPNSGNERSKVGTKFGAIMELYQAKHLPTLRHST